MNFVRKLDRITWGFVNSRVSGSVFVSSCNMASVIDLPLPQRPSDPMTRTNLGRFLCRFLVLVYPLDNMLQDKVVG
jgi:hypothetical protein